MLEKYGKKLFILLGCDVVYFILWVIPAIRIPASSAIFTGLGLMTMTALSFVEVEDDTFDRVTGDLGGSVHRRGLGGYRLLPQHHVPAAVEGDLAQGRPGLPGEIITS